MPTKWGILFTAGLLEIMWAIAIKYYHLSNDNNRLYFLCFAVVAAILAFVFLTIAIKDIPVGVAYTVWTGMGIVGITIYDIIFFHESGQPIKIIMILMILAGIIGLKVID